MPERVTILGNGAMATVCSVLLAQNGHRVTMWGAFAASVERLTADRENRRLLPGVRIPAGVRLTANDADCFDDATIILTAIPTQHMRSVWTRLRPHVPAGVPVVSVAKGVENDTLLRPTEVVADVMGAGRGGSEDRGKEGENVEGRESQVAGDETASGGRSSRAHPPSSLSPTSANPLIALSGPNIAGEIARALPSMAVAACADEAVARRVQATFATQAFRVYTNADVVGVEVAGATKNVIAIAAGILDGLSAGNNAKAALVTRGLVEITRLGVAMGARPDTFTGLAGLGDLLTTCVSPEGRNRTVGEQIGRGRSLADVLSAMNSVAEGVPTTKSVRMLAARHGVEMPIAEAVHAVLFDGKDAKAALNELMTRDPKAERGAW